MQKLMTSFVAVVLMLTASLRAQTPLADRVPGDALAYIAWAGSDKLADKYDQSHFKAFVDASDMPKFFDQFIPQVIDRLAKESPEAADVMKQVVAIGGPLWKHPSAIYFGGVDWTGAQPQPKLAVLCDAGDDAQSLAQRIDKLLKDAEKEANGGPFPSVKTYGSLVVLSFGTPAMIDAMFQKPPADSLAKTAKFTAALQQVQESPAFVEYIDCPAILKLVDEGMQHNNNAKDTASWKRIRDSLGLNGLHEVIATAGFDGRDWGTQAFIGSSDSNTGVLSLLHGAPLGQDLLKAIPQTADSATAGRFDLDNLVGHIREVVGQLDPQTGDQFDEVMAKMNEAAGLDIRKDFLAVLGDEWAMYNDRSVAGPGLLGTVIVNRLRDADAADKAMTQLAQRLNGVMANAIEDAHIRIEFHDQVINGLTVHYLAIPLLTPSWAISDGNLYLGLYPQVVSAAADQMKKHSPSILDKAEYQTVMKRLGNHPASAMSFCNLPATAADSYTEILAISRLYLGIADIFGVHPPALMIPELRKITPELAPSGGVTWTDSLGLHSKSVTPFPGADFIAGGSVGGAAIIGEESMLASILLPSLNKARETANRAKCASNMHQIGLAILLYQNDNAQKYPDDLGTLTKTEQITAGVFICPSGSTALPPNLGNMTPDDIAKWVNDNSDYVYLGKGLKSDVPANKIILYEKDGAHEGDGMNMLFGDGHAEWFAAAVAQKMIEDQKAAP